MAGISLMAFWMGMLSQRVKNTETLLGGDRNYVERLVRLETKLTTIEEDLKSVKRAVEGFPRQLANLMTNTNNKYMEIHGVGGDEKGS